MTEMTIAFVAMLGLMGIGMPVAFAMTLVGFLGILMFYNWNWGAAIALLGIEPFTQSSNYLFVAIPLFILMGHFTYASGISTELFAAARAWVGHWRGGLVIATIGASGGFSAASGSSLATAGSLGTITIGEMRRSGIHPRIATAAVAAGGTLGILIPPSISMVLYGMIADQSIGRLLLAGLLPGVLLMFLYMAAVIVMSYLRPADLPRAAPTPLAERMQVTKGITGILLLALLVIGGIYGGVFTPTEAAGVGAIGAFLIVIYRDRGIRLPVLRRSLHSTATTTVMIFMILIGSHILNVFLAATRGPAELSAWVESLQLSPYLFLLIIVVMYLILGMFLDALAMIVLTIPLVQPIMVGMGFDAIWFGVIIMIVMEMALITPPVGMCVYVVKGVAVDVPIHVIFSGIWPFLAAMIGLVVLLTIFPQIALFLPNMMFN